MLYDWRMGRHKGVPIDTMMTKKFVDAVLSGAPTYTQAAREAGYAHPGIRSQELMKRANVLAQLEKGQKKAQKTILQLMDSRSDKIKLEAAKEVLDRTLGKAVQRVQTENTHVSIELDLSGKAQEIVDIYDVNGTTNESIQSTEATQ